MTNTISAIAKKKRRLAFSSEVACDKETRLEICGGPKERRKKKFNYD